MTLKDSIAQYEVSGLLEADRDLIRSLAERLAKGGPDGERIRQEASKLLAGKSGVAAALLRSPLVGANLDLTRDRASPRSLDL